MPFSEATCGISYIDSTLPLMPARPPPMRHTAMPAANELTYSSTSLTMPPAPALLMPPKSTSNAISTAPTSKEARVERPKRLVIIADDDNS